MRLKRPILTGLLALSLPILALAEPVTITDLRDQNITLPAPAERLVVVPLPMTSVAIALDGSSKRIVAMHPGAAKSVRDGFLGRMFPEAADIPSDIVIGGTFAPNLETILTLRPDAVIQWKEPDEIVTTLERAGLKVVALRENPPTQALNERNLLAVAQTIGQDERGAKIIDLHHKRLAEIEALTPNIGDKPKAIYLRQDSEKSRVATSDTYQNFWMQLAGADNPAAQPDQDGGITSPEKVKGVTPVTSEQILAWAPDVIFLSAFDDVKPADLYNEPLFANLPAVQNRRVYKMPHGGYRWDPGSHESPLAWTWASMVLHPEIFSFDLRNDMKAAYQLFYGYDLSEDDIDDILELEANSGSQGQDVFARR